MTRGADLLAGEVICHRFGLPAGERVDLELVQPAGAPPARLGLLDASCRPADSRLFVQRGVGLTVAQVDAQSTHALDFFACVGAQDARQRLGDFKILASRGRIAADRGRSVSDPIEVEPEGLSALCGRSVSDPIEVEPEGLSALCGRSVSDPIEVEPEGLSALCDRSVSDPIEVEPEGLSALCGRSVSDPIEVEPEGLSALCDRSPRLETAACALEPGDDISDGSTCAPQLILESGEARVTAHFGNAFGDDQDAYHFVLGGRTDLEARIESVEAEDLSGVALVLLDEAGRQLAMNSLDEGGVLRRTLDRGRYVLRADSTGAYGGYRLTLRQLELGW